MLKLKEALKACNIKQTALVAATGFGKTQVSLTLKSGKLPVDDVRWRAGVATLIKQTPALQQWLDASGLEEHDLYESDETVVKAPAQSLEQALCEITGRAVLSGRGDSTLVTRLARTVYYLFVSLRDVVGDASPYASHKESAALEILRGDV